MNPSSTDVIPDEQVTGVDVNRLGGGPAEGIGENGGWARSTRLAKSLMSSGAGVHEREYRLVMCGCVMRFSHLFKADHLNLVHHAYRIADGEVQSCDRQYEGGDQLTTLLSHLTYGWASFQPGHYDFLFQLLSLVGGPERADKRAVEVAAQEAIVRDVFGPNLLIEPRWLTTDVVGLARQMYSSDDFSALPVLADAFQDAGCEDAAILSHCRGNTPHVRGCWLVDEILKLRSEEVRLRRWGMTDPLTGIGSRQAFDTVLHGSIYRALTNSSPLSLLLVDLDNCKRFNHDFGHQAGDRMLQGIAVLLRDALGGDGFLARIGGEEFGVILELTDSGAAVNIAERLRRAVADWRFAADEGLPPEQAITVSVGVAATHDPRQWIDHPVFRSAASDALNRAKEGGRNRVSV